jgi:predicted DNA-binding transcriptional regulator YafY
MNDLRVSILEKLGYGKETAVTASRLAQSLGIPERQLREEIRELITEGWAIASSVSGSRGGYFIANSAEEVEEYIQVTRSRLIQDATRIRDFKRAAKIIRKRHQLPLLISVKG